MVITLIIYDHIMHNYNYPYPKSELNITKLDCITNLFSSCPGTKIKSL